MPQFFGKYRGQVENNIDPQMMGRVQVSVPAVLGEGSLSWAMPCAPYAGSGVGFFMIPPSGANVWVEFEGGDPDYPIWSGCFWGLGEAPATPAVAAMKVIKTDSVTITINDLPGVGGIKIETTLGAKIETRPHRHHYRQWHGRQRHHDRSTGVGQQRRSGGDLMPGFMLHVGATVLCSHGGQAQATVPNPRVRVGGQPIVTQAAPHVVAGCPFHARWQSRALRHGQLDHRRSAGAGRRTTGAPAG